MRLLTLSFVALFIFTIGSLWLALNSYAAPISKIRNVMKDLSKGNVAADVPFTGRASMKLVHLRKLRRI